MATVTDPAPLIAAAYCDWCKIPAGSIWYVILAALIDVGNGKTVSTDSQTLMDEARCLECNIPPGFVPYAILQATRGITTGGGGGGAVQVFSGHYGGGTPTDVPTTSAALAYDLDPDFVIWHWSGIAWE